MRPTPALVLAAACLCVAVGSSRGHAAEGGPALAAAGARLATEGPVVTLVAPHDGQALNAETLRVDARVTAAGRLHHVDVALDGDLVERVRTFDCRFRFSASFLLDLTALADGQHTLTVTATQGHVEQSSTAVFTLDRTLVPARVSQVEAAATPEPFACLSVEGVDDEAVRHGHRPRRLHLEGRAVMGLQSDGLNLAEDRIIITMGSHVVVIEPGMLRCRGRRERTCRFVDPSQPIIQRMQIEESRDGNWHFEIAGGPVPPGSERFFLRIGDDVGGIDLRTGEPLAHLRPGLATAFEAQATIGSDGGAVETTDASGVTIRLDVPAGALTRDTAITVTPFAADPLAGTSAAIHPGAQLGPEGLVFAVPATLSFDFSAAGGLPPGPSYIWLLTSPLTMLPHPGTADVEAGTVTAELEHFSPQQPGPGAAPMIDAAAILNALHAPLSLAEIQSAAQLLAFAQATGQDAAVDVDRLDQTIATSLAALFTQRCSAATTNPTDAALAQLLRIDAVAQQFGVTVTGLRTCESDVLEALIRQDGATARSDPSDWSLQRLLARSALAQQLAFPGAEALAIEQLDSALRVLLARAQQLCSSDATAGRQLLQRALGFAVLVSAVDPPLAGELQTALDNCGGGGGAPSQLAATITLHFRAFQYGEDHVDQSHSAEAVPAAFSISHFDGSLSLSFAQDGGTITMDGAANLGAHEKWFPPHPVYGPPGGYLDCSYSEIQVDEMMLEITPSVPGTFTISKGAWGFTGFGGLTIDTFPDANAAPISIPSSWVGGVLRLSARVNITSNGCYPPIAATASGRMMTIVFTPEP